MTVLDRINEINKVLKPEVRDKKIYNLKYGRELDIQMNKLSKQNKEILKLYLEKCKNLLITETENTISNLKGEELVRYIRDLNDKERYKSFVALDGTIKLLSKKELDIGNYFDLLQTIIWYEGTYDVIIFEENDFKSLQ